MDPSDETLVLACRAGEAAAWERLVDRYEVLVYSIARRAGLDHEQSIDVFQRVFATLVEHLAQIEQPALIGAWLATTARHEAWRVSRRERVLVFTSLDAPDVAEPLAGGPLPEELILRLEQQQQVRAAIAALDERCRRLLSLLFYRNDIVSYAEIAAKLGMSEGSVGPTRARCLRKLRKLLEDQHL
ncbi:MAG TPA: sigma-70 family RNA polymerase sigma factor [Roseiflexaceae bacterium]|nr:sigma-70 family RNA polymerase sigma factor [Roseiflexaceae bacterium]